jgi:hypothetical protein
MPTSTTQPLRHRRVASVCRCALAVISLAAPLTAAKAVETVWLGPGGDWTDPTRWSLGVPGPADTAVIGANAGSVTLDADRTISGFTQDGGSLNGSGALSVLGSARWSAGVQYGPGTTSFLGSLLLDGVETRTIGGPRTVVVGGVANWTGNTAAGNGTLSMTTSGGTSRLRITGEMIETQSFDHSMVGSSSGRVELQGRWHKLGSATSSIGSSFHNDGEVRIDAGRLRLGGGGQHSGVFDVAGGAVLELSGGTHGFDLLSTTTGGGLVHVSGGNAVFDGGHHTADLLLSGGTLAGANHRHTGAAVWTGGIVGGAGTTTFAGALHLDGAATHTIRGGPRTVVIEGVATWSGNTAAGNGTLSMSTSGGASTLRVAGDWIEAQGFDHAISASSSGRIEVAGRWLKQGGALSSIGASFHNDGEVRVDAGRLRLSGGGQHGGQFNLAEGAVLELASGTHVFGATSAVDGAGVLHISGGTAQMGAVAHTAKLLLSGGSLSGGDHWLQGTAQFNGGTITGAGVTTFAAGSAISGGAAKNLSAGRTLALAGDAAWEGNTAANNGTLFLSSTAGATSLRVEATLDERQGHDHLLTGNGTLTVGAGGRWLKTGGARSSFTSGVLLDNQGTVEVAAGTLQVARSFTNEGTVEVHAGAGFESTCFSGGGVCFRNMGLIKGSGVVQAPASGLENLGTIAPGHSIGTLTVEGPLRLAGGGALHIELASPDAFDQLVVTGALTLGGTLALWNAGYQPVLGDSFSVLAFGDSAGSFDQLSWHGFGSAVGFGLALGDGRILLTVTAVPEPATALALTLGLAVVGAAVRRRRKAARRAAR